MLEKLITALASAVIAVISQLKYAGIALLMAVECACVPLPSEIILPLVSRGEFTLWLVAVAGAVGCVLGSWLACAVGAWGGGRWPNATVATCSSRPAIWIWPTAGSSVMAISPSSSVACCRWCAPFIAFPAGVARMLLGRFTAYTSWLADLVLASGPGRAQAWRALEHVGPLFPSLRCADRRADLAGGVLSVWWHVRQLRRD